VKMLGLFYLCENQQCDSGVTFNNSSSTLITQPEYSPNANKTKGPRRFTKDYARTIVFITRFQSHTGAFETQ